MNERERELNNPLVRHGALWLAFLLQAGAIIWWAADVTGKLENQQAQIAALQATANERGKVINLIDGMQHDAARLEAWLEQIRQELDERAEYEQVIARQSEHIEAVDQRLGRVDERLLQIERTFGWGGERRGPGALPGDSLSAR